ncbi:hypothetical protein CYMTET_56900 [Cymbomonas tetramitiformis]|uniref:Uncharacterized protein n=1 Tax=Cymbomonas tetramitiformis TaxID=36881 RepID=A0AAE0BBA0_9CHLO|nr:hypothetical protein CYMTET_56900 [Cymbomonas tetramitiformis]
MEEDSDAGNRFSSNIHSFSSAGGTQWKAMLSPLNSPEVERHPQMTIFEEPRRNSGADQVTAEDLGNFNPLASFTNSDFRSDSKEEMQIEDPTLITPRCDGSDEEEAHHIIGNLVVPLDKKMETGHPPLRAPPFDGLHEEEVHLACPDEVVPSDRMPLPLKPSKETQPRREPETQLGIELGRISGQPLPPPPPEETAIDVAPPKLYHEPIASSAESHGTSGTTARKPMGTRQFKTVYFGCWLHANCMKRSIPVDSSLTDS